MKQYLYSAKAFDVLDRLDACSEYWEGKKGACIGVLQSILNGTESKEALKSIGQMLRNSSHPQVEAILQTFRKVARELKINL